MNHYVVTGTRGKKKVHYYIRLRNTDLLFLSPEFDMIALNLTDSLEFMLKTAFKTTKLQNSLLIFLVWK